MSTPGRRSLLQRARRGMPGGEAQHGDPPLPSAPSNALVTVLNNPSEYSYLKLLGLGRAQEAWELTPPPLPPGILPDVSLEDFQAFFNATAHAQRRYEHARQGEAEQKTAQLLEGARGGWLFQA